MYWVMFRVPCPTPDGQTAEDLYLKREIGISPEMQASAVSHGCRFHRAWHTEDGAEFIAIAAWESRQQGRAFYQEWGIEDEPGEVAVPLLGDVGLVPLP